MDRIMNQQQLTRSKGVTLLELIVAIAIVGILASLAVPAFDSQTKNAKLKSTASMLATAYNMARSEAVSRGAQVQVTGGSTGWTVSTVASAGPPVVASEDLNVFQVDSNGITWIPSTLPTITYESTGFRSFNGSEEVIEVKDSRGIGRRITISVSGSTKVEKFGG